MTDYDDFFEEEGEILDEIAEKKKAKSFQEVINRKKLDQNELDEVMAED